MSLREGQTRALITIVLFPTTLFENIVAKAIHE